MQEAGLAVDRQNYDLVYTAPLDGKTTLEDIYRTFNLDRPADFTGHSLSVSDVVVRPAAERRKPITVTASALRRCRSSSCSGKNSLRHGNC